jgi:hypothetical protein
MRAPPFEPTGVGSLPFVDVGEAIGHVADAYAALPFAPELPARPGEPGMIAGLWPPRFAPETDAVGATTLDADLADVKQHLDGEVFEAPRVRVAEERLKLVMAAVAAPVTAVHLAGPITLLRATRVRGVDGELWLQPRLRESAASFIGRAGAKLATTAAAAGRTAMVVLDEPLLSAPAVDVDNPANLLLMSGVLDLIARAGGKVGIHSCGPPPVDLLLHLDFELALFDAVSYGAELLARRRTLERFLRRGGALGVGVFDPRIPPDDVEAAVARVRALPVGDGAGIVLAGACGSGRQSTERERALAAALRALKARLLGAPT